MSLVNLLVGVVGWLGLLLVMAVSMTLAAIGTNCGRRSSAIRVPPSSRSSATARRSRHPEAAASASRGYRLDRLRQASLFAAAGYVTFLMAAALTAAGVSFALALSFWAMLAAGAGYPLLWTGGKDVWGRPLSALVLVAAIFVPCAVLVAVLVLHHQLGRALRTEGFQVTWLNAQPAAAPIAPTAPLPEERWRPR